MSKVNVAENSEVSEFNVSEESSQDDLPETTTETLARKRGRPRLSPEVVSPLEQAEKRMKTAKEKFYSERHALACKIIELHCRRAFDDHASAVARLRQRLDARAERVVKLQMEAEAAERRWECERSKADLAKRERVSALTQRVAALTGDVLEAQEEKVQLAVENWLLSEELLDSEHEFKRCEAKRKVEAAQADLDRLHAEARTARERVLWLTGIL